MEIVLISTSLIFAITSVSLIFINRNLRKQNQKLESQLQIMNTAISAPLTAIVNKMNYYEELDKKEQEEEEAESEEGRRARMMTYH